MNWRYVTWGSVDWDEKGINKEAPIRIKSKKQNRRERRITKKQCSCRIQHPETWKEEKQRKRWSGPISKRSLHLSPLNQVPHPWPCCMGSTSTTSSISGIASSFRIEAHLNSILNHSNPNLVILFQSGYW